MIRFATIAAVFILSVGTVTANQPVNTIPLERIRAVRVTVTDEDEGSIANNDLKIAVKNRLLSAGIAITNEKFAPWLGIEVDTLKEDNGTTFYTVEESLYDLMPSPRTRKIIYPEIWTAGRLGSWSALSESPVKHTVETLVDQFVSDWLAANPKN